MQITFLGTGTSAGVPVIRCRCPVCTSPDRRNRRWRSSLYVEAGGQHLVIDTSTDFREQALAFNVPRVDAVLITHAHADHVFGLDDMRRYNVLQDAIIPVYAAAPTVADLRRIFNYVTTAANPAGLWRPRLDFQIRDAAFEIGSVRVTPLPVKHGHTPTLGFRLDSGGQSLGYVPDCHEMPPATEAAFRGVDTMILDTLRVRAHPTHLALADSVALLGRLGAARSFLTHIGHELDHAAAESALPPGIRAAYDGLTVNW